MTETLLEDLLRTLPTAIFAVIVIITSANLYLKIRRKFKVRVNCWFCNEWTRVLYDDQNAFDCPTCRQYNGFDSSGGYNRVILAQYDELFNTTSIIPQKKLSKSNSNGGNTNGLCQICNNNLRLKTFQLANFVPLRKENYNQEIEHFEKQLEFSYKLCSSCQDTVNKTIRRQNSKLGLKKLARKLGKQGLHLVDIHKSSPAKLALFNSLIRASLLVCAVLNLGYVLYKLELPFVQSLGSSSSKFILRHISTLSQPLEHVKTNIFTLVNNALESIFSLNSVLKDSFLWEYVVKSAEIITIYLEYVCQMLFWAYDRMKRVAPSVPVLWNGRLFFDDHEVMLTFVGALMELILLILWRNNKNWQMIHLALWTLMVVGHWNDSSLLGARRNIYFNWLQIVCSCTLILSMIFFFLTNKTNKRKQSSFKKWANNMKAYEYSENYSEDEGDCPPHASTFDYVNTQPNFEKYLPTKDFKYGDVTARSFAKIPPRSTFGGQPTFSNFRLVNSNNSSLFDSLSSRNFHGNNSQMLSSFTSLRSPASECTTSLSGQTNTSVRKSMDFFGNGIDKDFCEINTIMDKLDLGGPKRSFELSTTYPNIFGNRSSKPILSPSKLKNLTQNSWVAGGFWLDSNGMPTYGVQSNGGSLSPLSRSSSQTSGFASQQDQQSPPQQQSNKWSCLVSPTHKGNSFNFLCGGEFEQSSILLEPIDSFPHSNVVGVQTTCRNLYHQNNFSQDEDYSSAYFNRSPVRTNNCIGSSRQTQYLSLNDSIGIQNNMTLQTNTTKNDGHNDDHIR